MRPKKRSSLNFGDNIRKNTENSERYSEKLGKLVMKKIENSEEKKIGKNTPENYSKNRDDSVIERLIHSWIPKGRNDSTACHSPTSANETKSSHFLYRPL